MSKSKGEIGEKSNSEGSEEFLIENRCLWDLLGEKSKINRRKNIKRGGEGRALILSEFCATLSVFPRY